MLHFIYDPFIPMIARRQMPDVILNHERVANHYLIPSINLCQEIGERMQNGEFTWDEFGGTHPKPFGHKFYAAAIGHLFDEMWKGVSPEGQLRHTTFRPSRWMPTVIITETSSLSKKPT